MTAALPVLPWTDPVLQRRSAEVQIQYPLDPDLAALIDRLIATAAASHGVGIAAPQIGQGLRLIIVASRPTLRYPQAPTMAPTAMINPEIITRSAEQLGGWEGCLSVPGQRGWIDRHSWVTLTYRDRQGQHQHQQFDGFVARIIQHEIDHLDGIAFLDRAQPSQIISEADYEQLILNSPIGSPAAPNSPARSHTLNPMTPHDLS
jgi:peptide deformylase